MFNYYFDSLYSYIRPGSAMNIHYKYFLKPDSSKKVSEDVKWKIMICSHLYFIKDMGENFISVRMKEYLFK